MSEWKEVELGEIINLKRGYDLPNSNRVGGVVPIISSSGVTGCHNLHKEIGPGVVTGRYGTLGEFYYIKPGEKYWPLNTTLFVEDFKGNDPEFIYYLLSTLGFGKLGHKSAVPGLNRNELHEILVRIPDSDTQKEIARTLSIIDKKITLLHQQNHDLEDLAQTLFKRWFVEFEFPNENGEPYKSSGGKMVGSELGEIPDGWRVGAIKDFGKIVCGKTPSKQTPSFYGNDIPFLKIPDMHGTVYPLNSVDNLSNEGSKNQLNKLIPAKSLVVSCIATVGLVCINPYDCHTNQQINSVVLKDIQSRYYLFHSLKGMKSVLENIGSGGSATLNVNTSVFSNIEVLVPSSERITQHYSIVNPIFEKLLTNQKEIQTLTQLRDTLLPRLMSGEVRMKINNIEKCKTLINI